MKVLPSDPVFANWVDFKLGSRKVSCKNCPRNSKSSKIFWKKKQVRFCFSFIAVITLIPTVSWLVLFGRSTLSLMCGVCVVINDKLFVIFGGSGMKFFAQQVQP